MNSKNDEKTVNFDRTKSARTPCEIFSRPMGFVRPVKNFNTGKYQEFLDRNVFKEANALTTGQRHLALLKDSLLKAA